MPLIDSSDPLRVVVFFSGSASGARYLADYDPKFTEKYELVGAVTDDPDAPGVSLLTDRDIPVITHDIQAFYAERSADTSDLEIREEYDAETAAKIDRFTPDVLLLSGYLWILTAPVIETYPTINVHPADLTITDADGDRVYVGFDPVYDAITDGQPETRSSVHLVTAGVDAGPLLVRSRPIPVHQPLVTSLQEYDATDGLRDYADAHQEWMKWAADGPSLAAALDAIADEQIEEVDGELQIHGQPGPIDLAESE